MKHSTVNRKVMLDWITVCSDEDRPMPTDGQISDRFGWSDDGSLARSLLVELAEAGSIRLTGYGVNRVIALGKSKPKPLPVLKIDRTPKRAAEPSRRDMIAAVGARLAARRAGQDEPDLPQIWPTPVAPQEAAPPPAAIVKPVPVVAPTPAAAPVLRPPVPLQATPPKRSQINLHVSRDLYLTVKAEADAAGVSVSRHALERLEKAFAAPDPVPTIKPRVTVAIYRAWQAGGMRQPLHVFVDDMLALGMAAAKHERVMAA